MNKIDSIDYEMNPQIKSDLERLINFKLKDLFKSSDQSDLFEYIKILTSKDYTYSKEKQESDLKEVCEDESPEKIKELVIFVQKELPQRFNELKKIYIRKEEGVK